MVKFKRFILPAVAIIVCLGLAFSVSGFKDTNNPKNKKALTTTYYFQYLPANNFTESAYETASNWSYVGTSAGSDPCPGADVMPCVIHADLATGSNAPSDLVAFLGTSAKIYAESDANISHKKPSGE